MSVMGLLISAALASAAMDRGEGDLTQREIAKACDHSTPVDVRWEAFGDDADGKAAFVGEGLGFLRTAMQRVCSDQKLKKEFKSLVTRIVISQAYGAADPMIYLHRQELHIEYLWAKGEPGPDAAFVFTEIASRLKGEPMAAP